VRGWSDQLDRLGAAKALFGLVGLRIVGAGHQAVAQHVEHVVPVPAHGAGGDAGPGDLRMEPLGRCVQVPPAHGVHPAYDGFDGVRSHAHP
jgi:hypothetical protein